MRTIFSIIIAGAVLMFAIANAATITLHLLLWKIEVSLALLTGIVFLLGFLFGVLRLTPSFWRGRTERRESDRSLVETRNERDVLAKKVEAFEERDRQEKESSRSIKTESP